MFCHHVRVIHQNIYKFHNKIISINFIIHVPVCVLKFDLTYMCIFIWWCKTYMYTKIIFHLFIFVRQALVKLNKNNILKPLIELKEGYCHTDLRNSLPALHLRKDWKNRKDSKRNSSTIHRSRESTLFTSTCIYQTVWL